MADYLCKRVIKETKKRRTKDYLSYLIRLLN